MTSRVRSIVHEIRQVLLELELELEELHELVAELEKLEVVRAELGDPPRPH